MIFNIEYRGRKRDDYESREKWIDALKAICMIFIIMSHLLWCPKILRYFLTSFFLVGFYFASGYVMKPLSIRKFFMKKVKTILWPWLIFSIIEIIIIFKFGNCKVTLIKYIFYTLLQVKGLHESLWFLPSLFVTLIFVDALILKFDFKKLSLLSIAMLFVSRLYGMLMPQNLLPWKSVCLPWHLHNIGTTSFFVILGYIYKKKSNKYKNKKPVLIVSLMLIIMYLIELYITRDTIEIGIWNYTQLFSWIFVIGTGLAMIIFTAQIKIFSNNSVLGYIGRNTLLYYVLHQNVCRVIERLISKWSWGYSYSQTLIGQWIFTVLFTIFILLILTVPIEFIKRKMNYLIEFVW